MVVNSNADNRASYVCACLHGYVYICVGVDMGQCGVMWKIPSIQISCSLRKSYKNQVIWNLKIIQGMHVVLGCETKS